MEYLLDSYAPEPGVLDSWIANYRSIVELGDIPLHLNRSATAEDRAVIRALEDACETQPFTHCQQHIKANRFAIIQSLPSNPAYWAAFWEVFEHESWVNFDLERGQNTNGEQQLIQGAYWWFYRSLAKDGKVNPARLLTIQEALNRWRSGHQPMILRMYALAVQGIVVNQLSFAMAQASRMRAHEEIRLLSGLSQPLDVQLMSWGGVLWMEREFSLRNQELQKDSYTEEDIRQALGMVPDDLYGESLKLLMSQPKAFLKKDYDDLAKQFVPATTMSWRDYWTKGLPEINMGSETFSFMAISAPAYNSYVVNERIANFRMFIFAALADVYAGRVSPGHPARPAPEFWRWEWVEGEQQKLCLVGEVNPSTIEGSPGDMQWCVDYYSEEDVERLLIQ